MRARWALLEAGLCVQWREIELKHKPAEMLQCSAKGHGAGVGADRWHGDR